MWCPPVCTGRGAGASLSLGVPHVKKGSTLSRSRACEHRVRGSSSRLIARGKGWSLPRPLPGGAAGPPPRPQPPHSWFEPRILPRAPGAHQPSAVHACLRGPRSVRQEGGSGGQVLGHGSAAQEPSSWGWRGRNPPPKSVSEHGDVGKGQAGTRKDVAAHLLPAPRLSPWCR